MILSVVVPTHNKVALLQQTLGALAKQSLTAGDWEVVVVDDGSSDGTGPFLAGCRRDWGGRLSVVTPDRNVGRAKARNLGIEAARGEFVLFIDDDIVVPAGLLESHLDLLRDHPGCGTIGMVATAAQLRDGPHFHYIDSRGVAKVVSGPVPARYFITQNAAVPRRALIEVDGFDDRFTAYGLEDMEIAFRLEDRLGLSFRALKAPVPEHVHHHSLAEYLDKKRITGGMSLPLLAELHPARIGEMQLHWIIDPPGVSQTARTVALFRFVASGVVPDLLQAALQRWPTATGDRPLLPSIYYKLLDGMVLCAMRQGLTEECQHQANVAQ